MNHTPTPLSNYASEASLPASDEVNREVERRHDAARHEAALKLAKMIRDQSAGVYKED